jgi:hypothetical protein
VKGGTLSIYRKLYEDANGDMDVFLQMAKKSPLSHRHKKVSAFHRENGDKESKFQF